MRSPLTTAITMLVLVGIVGVGGYVGWNAVKSPMPGITTGKSCTTKTVEETLKSNQVQVSVYNAGDRAGLAGDTLKKLNRRGFRSGALGNVSDKVRKVLVRTSIENSPEARLVALQFGKKVEPLVSDVDLGPGVDVIVGNKFKGLAKAVKKLKYTKDVEVCS